MEILCPHCQKEMVFSDGDYVCKACQQHYQQEALCPDCGKPLQVHKACGAVDYFCQHGHGLISKKRVQFRYIPVEGE